MNVQVVKNPVEEALSRQFAEISAELPGGEGVTRMRSEAMARFEAQGLPHRRVEEWKYTDLRNRLAEAHAPTGGGGDISWQALEAALGSLVEIDAARLVIVDGRYSEELSNPGTAGGDVRIMALRDALSDSCFAESVNWDLAGEQPDASMIALNTAFMTDGVAIHIGGAPDRPLHIVHATTGDVSRSVTTRNNILVDPGVSATILESHVGLGEAGQQVNALTQLGIGDDAAVVHVKVQREALATTHLGTAMVQLGARARYRATQFNVGSALARNDMFLHFGGAESSAHVNGVYLERDNQHCDTRLVVDHVAPGCESRELFKAVLDDDARGVFQGKIMVKPEAQKTDGKQMSQGLLLSDRAEFDSKPELEIFADDVVCGHGATSGQIDEEMLFYLRARGVPEATARSMLIQAFVGEVFDAIENEALRSALEDIAATWLETANT